MSTVQVRFKLRRYTAAEWTAANEILLLGEPGFEKDTRRLKVGDGVTAWNSLPYIAEDQAAVVAETAARIAGDAALSTRVSGIEVLGPLATDAELAAEAATRAAADSAEQSARLIADSTEAANRAAFDATLIPLSQKGVAGGVATTERLANPQATGYTTVLSDAGKAIEYNSASAGIYTIPANATVPYPTGTLLEFPQIGAGALTLAPAGGVTITGDTVTPGIGGSLLLRKTGTNAWFGAIVSVRSGTYAGAKTVPVVFTPEAYGAVGDATADDTAAVVAAFAAATALRSPVIGGNVFEPRATVHLRGKYKLTTLSSQIVASCNLDGAEATLLAPPAYAGTVLLVGHETSGLILDGAKIVEPTVTKFTPITSLVPGSVGVKYQNLWHSEVRGRRLTYFETARLATGLGSGTVYNNFHLGGVDLCKRGLALVPGAGGWVNSNRFVGGGISQSPNTLDGTGIRRPGWRQLVIDGSAGAGTVNCNTFDGISFEGDLSEFFFDIKHASNNTWQGGTRFEQGTTARAVTLATDTFTDVGHGLVIGDMVVPFATTTRPGGMNTGLPYFVSSVPTVDTFQVAETFGGVTVSFTSNGVGVVYYTPPRIRIDGSGGSTFANEIQSGYFSFPGALDVRRVNNPYANTIEPPIPVQGDLMPGRNRIINGNFQLNQRGYVSAAFVAADVYCFDRWKSTTSGTTLTYTAAPQGQPVVINTGGSVAQVIDRANLEPGRYTLSWRGTSQAQVYNVGGAAPGYSASPITVDIVGTADVVVEFIGAGRISEIQFERGIVATPFERRPIGTEMLLCKRFFQRIGTGAAGREPVGTGIGAATTSGFVFRPLPVEMRAVPALTVTSPTTFRINVGGTLISPTVISLDATSSSRNVRIAIATAAGLTAGGALYLDTGDGYFDLSAEL